MVSHGKGDLTGNFDDISPSNNGSQNYNRPSEADYKRFTHLINSNIRKITQYVQEIQKMVDQLGSKEDTASLRNRLQKRLQDTNQLSNNTTKHIEEVNALPPAYSVSDQRDRKSKTERLIKEFTEVLSTFQAVQNEAITASKECIAKARAAAASAQDQESDVGYMQGNTQSQQQSAIATKDLAEIGQRAEALRKLEEDILTVNEIFRDLGSMVEEQGHVIDTIEGHVEEGVVHIEEGNKELIKAKEHKKSSRRKKIICAVVGIVALIVIILIIYFSVSG